MDAAETLLQTDNLSDITLAEIAALAGVSKGTLYYHYKDKTEILFGLTDRYLDKQWDELVSWTENKEKDTSIHRLVKYVVERNVASAGIRLHLLNAAMSSSPSGSQMYSSAFFGRTSGASARVMFDFDQRRLLELAGRAKKQGAELFVLDDGWFGARNSDRAGLGDYGVNEKKLPEGLGGFAGKLAGLGLNFGLWFEPEAVNPDSGLYRAHPDWAIHQPGRSDLLSRHELLLDLRKEAVRDYIVDSVTEVLNSADIRYVKWDMGTRSPSMTV